MKNIFGFVAICFASNVLAQETNGPARPVNGPNSVELVSIEQMPMPLPPGEADKMRNGPRTTASDGYSSLHKAPHVVKGFHNHMNMVKASLASQGQVGSQLNERSNERMPKVHKDLSGVKVKFRPANLARGTLVAATPHGMLINGAWTGLDRFIDITGVGSVRLSEVDLAAGGGKFFMAKEAVNTRVRGQPAISKVFSDEDGQTVEEVLWVEGNKLFMLTLAPIQHPSSKAKNSPHVTAHSLAQELH